MPASASHPRRAFIWVACAFLITMMGTTLPTPLYVFYQQEMGFGETWVTLIFSIYAAGVIAALLVAGSWSDQLGRRPMLLAGIALSAISTVMFLFSHSISGLMLARLFSGFSAGIYTGTATVAVLELAPEPWRNVSTLVATASNMLGLGLGPLVAGILSTYLPYPTHLVFSLYLILLVVAAVGVLLVHETVQRPAKPRLRIQKPHLPREVRALFIPAALSGMAGFSVAGLFTAVVPAIMGQVMGHTHGVTIGAVICLLFVSSIIGQALLKKLPAHLHMTIGCIALSLGTATIGVSIATAQVGFLLLGTVIAGAGQGIVFRAGMNAVTGASPREHKASVTSTLFVTYYVAMSVPVIGVGVSAEAFGLRQTGEFFAAVVTLVPLLAMVIMWIVQSRQRETGRA